MDGVDSSSIRATRFAVIRNAATARPARRGRRFEPLDRLDACDPSAPQAEMDFDWSDVSGASSYELEVDIADHFPSPVNDMNIYTSSSCNNSFSLADNLYYWRVRATDASGNQGEWSETWSFTLQTTTTEYGNIVVSGAGWDYLNGTYTFFGMSNGKPSWWKEAYWAGLPNNYINWRTDQRWVMDYNIAALSAAPVPG